MSIVDIQLDQTLVFAEIESKLIRNWRVSSKGYLSVLVLSLVLPVKNVLLAGRVP